MKLIVKVFIALTIFAAFLLSPPKSSFAQELSEVLIERINVTDREEMAQLLVRFDRVPVIVELLLEDGRLDYELDAEGRADRRDRIARLQDELIEAYPRLTDEGFSLRRFTVLPYLSFAADASLLETLARSPLVARIHYNRPERIHTADAVRQTGTPVAWNLGYTGAGKTIVVLDTGVELTHEAFDGKVVAEACFSFTWAPFGSESLCPGGAHSFFGVGAAAECDESINGCGHGTHVAGIALGNSPSFQGIAPDANLIPIQVFSVFDDTVPSLCNGNSPCVLSYVEDQIRALEYVYNQYITAQNLDIVSVNMSLGAGQAFSFCNDDSRRPIIQELTTAGVPVIIAAGNNGFLDSITFPACIEEAVSVGALTKFNSVTYFSNSATFLDVLAPGALLNSAVIGNTYGPKSGTSMAAPVIAGAFAILRQAYPHPQASVADLLALIKNNGKQVTDHRNGLTHPALAFQNIFPAQISLPAEPITLTATPSIPVATTMLSIGNNGVSPLNFQLRNLLPANPGLVLHHPAEPLYSSLFGQETHHLKNPQSSFTATLYPELQSTPIYSTSFEAEENFTIGFIHNQNGWLRTNSSANAMPVIGTGRSRTGTQALRLAREGSITTGVRSPQINPTGSVVRYRASIFTENAGWWLESASYFIRLLSESAQLTELEFNSVGLLRTRLGNGTIQNTGLYLEAGSWQQLEIVYDEPQQEIRFYYGPDLIQTYSSAFSTFPSRIEFVRSGTNNTHVAWIDDVVVESLLPGFTADTLSGTIEANESTLVQLNFDSDSYEPGRYTGLLELHSNDAAASFREIEWQLDVHGEFIAEIGSSVAQQSSGWRLLSTPVSTTLAELLAPVWTQGAIGSDHPGSDQPNVLLYDGAAYVPVPDLNTPFGPGESVIVYVFSQDSPDENSLETWPKILSVTGLDPQETVTPHLQNSSPDGFSLIGNPFVSPISFDDLIKESVRNQVWVYDHNYTSGFDTESGEGAAGAGGGWRVWNGEAGSLTQGIIAPFQAFFVQNETELSETPEVQFPREARRQSGGNLYRKPDTVPQLQLAARMNGALIADLWLSFSELGSTAEAPGDMLMLYPLDYHPFLAMFTTDGARALSLKQLPQYLDSELTLPLFMEGWAPGDTGYVPLHGEIELNWAGIADLHENIQLFLHDMHTGVQISLRETNRYVFQTIPQNQTTAHVPAHAAEAGPQPFHSDRDRSLTDSARFNLIVHTGSATVLAESELPRNARLYPAYPNPFNPVTNIRYELPQAADVRLDVFNLMGQRVATLVNEVQQAGVHTVQFNGSALSSGVYLYRIQAGSFTDIQKITLLK